jgi:hypothetical protein
MSISIASLLWRFVVIKMTIAALSKTLHHTHNAVAGVFDQGQSQGTAPTMSFCKHHYSVRCNGSAKANNPRQIRETEVRFGAMCAELVEEHCVER